MTVFATGRPAVVIVALLVSVEGCDFLSREAPEIAAPLGYGTVRVTLPGCPTELPPVREDSGCGAREIGKAIDHRDVCRLLTSLKHWVESSPADGKRAPVHSIRFEPVYAGDWKYVRAVCVSRGTYFSTSDGPGGGRTTERRFLQLKADAPNRSLQMWVRLSEQPSMLEYFSARRSVTIPSGVP